ARPREGSAGDGGREALGDGGRTGRRDPDLGETSGRLTAESCCVPTEVVDGGIGPAEGPGDCRDHGPVEVEGCLTALTPPDLHRSAGGRNAGQRDHRAVRGRGWAGNG